MNIKKIIAAFSLVSILSVFSLVATKTVSADPDMTVYKSPTCGCCDKWITHMEENGFQINAIDVLEMSIVKDKYGINGKLESCHTAEIDGYFIEGHVPATDVKRLLSERPDISGLTVPGMPIGSPGMEMGDRKDAYSVLAIEKGGDIKVFNQY